MTSKTVTLYGGTPEVLWCDSCMTGSQLRLDLYTMNAHGVTRAMRIDRCVNDGHDT